MNVRKDSVETKPFSKALDIRVSSFQLEKFLRSNHDQRFAERSP